MSATIILSAVREMLVAALLLMSPFLLAAVLTSFVIGLFQASTRTNDLTLSFVPRFVAVMLVIYFAASWVAAQMVGYIERSAVAMRAFLE
jgi:flagellar biosynthesis protein FliQ